MMAVPITFRCGHTLAIDQAKFHAMPAWKQAVYVQQSVCTHCYHGRAVPKLRPLAARYGAGALTVQAVDDVRARLLPCALAAVRRVVAQRPDLEAGAARVALLLTSQTSPLWWSEHGAEVVRDTTILEHAQAWEDQLAVAC